MAYGSKMDAPPKKEKKAPMKKEPKKKDMSHNDMSKKLGGGDLTNEQIAKLSKHKFAHSAAHIAMMRKDMKAGMSFTAAHNKAMKEVGK
jgi:hypothetical protein